MKEMVDRIAELTKSKMIMWQRSDRDINEHSEEQRLKNAFMVVNFAPCISRTFGGAYIGLRGRRKILCVAIIDGIGNWHYIDAKREVKGSVKDLFRLVKNNVSKRKIRRMDRSEMAVLNESEKLEKTLMAKDRAIARLKREILELRKHLSVFGVGKKRVWEYP
ncbi:MAG: hypothetical protein M1155_00705 [Patescibacteria group bacterium]|nr:hypothetical protein [Patescibacteria group bacterium]